MVISFMVIIINNIYSKIDYLTILIQITETFNQSIIQKLLTNQINHPRDYKLFAKIHNKAMINQVYILDFVPPQFIMRFKQKIVNFLIPKLYDLKDLINSQQNKSESTDPIIAVVFVLIIAYIIKTVYKGLFQQKQLQNLSNSSSNFQYEQLNRQLLDMKKQLIAFKQSFIQLKKSISQNNEQHQIGAVSSHDQILPYKQTFIQSNNNQSLMKQLFPLYSKSIQNNKKLAMYILDSQQQAFKQLKRLRKVNHLSTSNARPSTRSRTSDTKLIASSEKSTQKKSINSTFLKENLPVEKQKNLPLEKQYSKNLPVKRQKEVTLNAFSNTKEPVQVEYIQKAINSQPKANEPIEKVQQKNNQRQLYEHIQQTQINAQPIKLPIDEISPLKQRKVVQKKNLNSLQDDQLHNHTSVEQPKLFNQFELKQSNTRQTKLSEVVVEEPLKQELINNIDRAQESTQVILNGPPVAPPKIIMKKPVVPSKMGARKAPPPPLRK